MSGGLWLLLAACGAVATPTPSKALPSIASADQQWNAIFQGHSSPEEAVTALIVAERQATIDQDLGLLGQLWAADASIVDGRGTLPTTDDYVWQGRAAILDRYRVAVFPFTLPPLSQLAVGTTITITGNEATVHHHGDQWQLVKVEQRWWLLTLRYQLAPMTN